MLMENQDYFEKYFDLIGSFLHSCDFSDLDKASQIFADTTSSNSKVILAGNGGSAAMASHVAVDLTKAAGIRAVNFNEADLLTCLANDFGYENWIARALDYYADPGDVVVLISSSGQSRNILKAAETTHELGLTLITFSGFASDNELRGTGTLNFWVNSSSYNIVEMTHHTWLVAIVDYICSNKKD
jgi:D-sedoheptulose 7-phosphate isomerase